MAATRADVDPRVYACLAGVQPGHLVSIDTTNDTVVHADKTTLKPAHAFVYDKPTATSCRLRNDLNNIITGFVGITGGTQYFLGTAGAITSASPTSGQLHQQVAIGVSSADGAIKPAIDRHSYFVVP